MSQSCVSLLTKSQNKIYVVCFMWCLWNMKSQFSFFSFMNTLLSLFQYIKKYLNYLWLSWMVLMTNKCKWFATRALFEFYLTFMNCFQFSCDFSIQNCFDIFSQIVAFRSSLENCLLEEMCLELKIALKNVLKNVQEAVLLIPKIFSNTFETIFQCSF